MIIFKGIKVNRQLNSDFWKDKARGTIDPYGNPFRIIKLRWNRGEIRPNSEYAKTRGFEDAVISKSSSGDFKIRYRRDGSVTWMRAPGGIGPFIAELPLTPINIKVLTKAHGDKMWTIEDHDIRSVVEKLYAVVVEKMTPEESEFNKKRIEAMNTRNLSVNPNSFERPTGSEKDSVEEERRQNEIRRQELDKREAELANREKQMTKSQVEDAGKDVSPINYSEEYVRNSDYNQRRAIAKELGVMFDRKTKSEELYRRILDFQKGVKKIAELEPKTEDDLINAAINGSSADITGFNMDETKVAENEDDDDTDVERLDD